MQRVIDTNVPVVANYNDSPQATEECHLACVDLLDRIFKGSLIPVIDDV
jgi:hypothetical protein